MRRQKQRTLALFLALLLCLTASPALAAETVTSATAATMQLMKTEGTVSVTSSTTRSLTVRDNMRLYNGYRIGTQAKSYAWISLDSAKLTKLDAVSEAEIRKSGKVLELLVNSGSLYFNVTSPLKEDETLNIRTSTMVVGIRGTCGWVRVLDRWSTEIYVLEGTVQCSVTDPVTGQVKTAELTGGDKAVALAYPQDQEGDKCDILLDRFGPGDVGGFVLEELAQDPGLCGDIFEASGMDVLPPMGVLESARRQSEKIREELDSLREQMQGDDPSIDDAQSRLDDLRQQLEDVKGQLEQADPDEDAQRRLDEAQEHLEQAQEALGSDNIQDAMDSLDNTQRALESAQQQQADAAQQQGAESAQGRLEQEQQEMQDTLDRIEEELAGQDHNVSNEPVWGENGERLEPGGDSDSSGSGGGSSDSSSSGGDVTDNTPDSSTDNPADDSNDGLTMPLTARQVQDLLDGINEGETVALKASKNAADNLLTVDINMTVAKGKTLTLEDGIDVAVEGSSYLLVDGSMHGGGTFTNNGALIVNSNNTLEMNTIENFGSIINNDTGRIVTSVLRTRSELGNAGIIEGTVIHVDGDTEITGGTLKNSSSGAALVIQGGGTISVLGGTVDGGSLPAILVDNSSAEVTIGEESSSRRAVLKSKTPGSVIRLNGSSTVNFVVNTGGGNYENITISSDSVLTTASTGDGSYQLVGASREDFVQILNSAGSGEVVILPRDMTTAAALYIPYGNGSEENPVALDLNGHTLTMTGTDANVVYGSLRVFDSSGTGRGRLEISSPILAGGNYLNNPADVLGCLFLDSGTIDSGDATAIDCSYGFFTINGGEVISAGAGTVKGLFSEMSFKFNGGTITNSGNGYAIDTGDEYADYEGETVGTTIRAKSPTNIAGGPNGPVYFSGYTSTERPDADGYYYLIKID